MNRCAQPLNDELLPVINDRLSSIVEDEMLKRAAIGSVRFQTGTQSVPGPFCSDPVLQELLWC